VAIHRREHRCACCSVQSDERPVTWNIQTRLRSSSSRAKSRWTTGHPTAHPQGGGGFRLPPRNPSSMQYFKYVDSVFCRCMGWRGTRVKRPHIGDTVTATRGALRQIISSSYVIIIYVLSFVTHQHRTATHYSATTIANPSVRCTLILPRNSSIYHKNYFAAPLF